MEAPLTLTTLTNEDIAIQQELLLDVLLDEDYVSADNIVQLTGRCLVLFTREFGEAGI